jgi:transposase InsO family protein
MEEVGSDPVPLSTTTIDGSTAVNMCVDYGSKLMCAYEARTEGQQMVTVRKIQRDWCIPYGHKIKTIHSDYGSYFVGVEFQDFCLEEGIAHDASAPYLHQHNLVEGSCVRIAMSRARVILADSGLPATFAGYAIHAAIHS